MLIDTHCHLDFPDFEPERDAVVQRALDDGIARMVTISTRVRRFDQIRAIAERHDAVFCSVGTHPHNAGEEEGIPASELIALAEHPKCVAIGEAGLDYHYDKAPRDAQAASFRTHIAAARETGLPLVIHARSADDDVAAILRDESGKGAFPFILHCFSSGRALAEIGVELGGYVSFSGILTFSISASPRLTRTVPRTDDGESCSVMARILATPRPPPENSTAARAISTHPRRPRRALRSCVLRSIRPRCDPDTASTAGRRGSSGSSR